MVVAASRDGSREVNTRSVDGLEDSEEMRAASYFFDEEGGEAFRAELLVHAEEVDLGAALRSGREIKSDRRPERERRIDHTLLELEDQRGFQK